MNTNLLSTIVAGPLMLSIFSGQADAEFTVDVKPGLLQARLSEGGIAWRVLTPADKPSVLRHLPNGLILTDNGVALGPAGEVLTVAHRERDFPGAAPGRESDCPYWTDLAEITPPPAGFHDAHAPLLMDSAGNAWVINTHLTGSDYELQVRQSDGHSGAWFPMQTISDSTNYVSQPEGAIDADDNITIVFRDISGGYHLYAIRYEPDAGWGELTKFHSTSTFFQAIEVAADSEGNVVAVFDPSPNFNGTVWSAVRDTSTGIWSSPVQISHAGHVTLLPTLSQNNTGTALYVVYLVEAGGQVGLYGHRWDAATKEWGPAQLLPGSETAGYSIAGPSSRYPLAVGSDGEATIMWQTAYPGPYTLWASRTSGGAWQPAHVLLPSGPHDTDLENFACTNTGNDGDVMGVITRYESGANRFWAFRHSADEGWWEAENPYTSSLNISTRVRTAFYQGAKATGTLLGFQGGQAQLTSLRYTGTGWLPNLIDIPQPYVAYYQDPIVDRGEQLLVYEAELGGSNQGIKATWLRNLVGDVNCDGVIDIDDLFDVLSAWGPCPHVPEDCPADLDGDGIVDIDDVFEVLANWT